MRNCLQYKYKLYKKVNQQWLPLYVNSWHIKDNEMAWKMTRRLINNSRIKYEILWPMEVNGCESNVADATPFKNINCSVTDKNACLGRNRLVGVWDCRWIHSVWQWQLFDRTGRGTVTYDHEDDVPTQQKRLQYSGRVGRNLIKGQKPQIDPAYRSLWLDCIVLNTCVLIVVPVSVQQKRGEERRKEERRG